MKAAPPKVFNAPAIIMLLETIRPIALRLVAHPLPGDVVHVVVPIVAALGIGAIIGAVINLVGNSAAQRRRDARQDVGVRLQLQAMLSDLLAVVQHARDHGTFLRATWNARVARLVAKLQEESTAPALHPATYRQLLYAASQAEHFALVMDGPEMQTESPEDLRKLLSLRRKWRSDHELRALGQKRQQVAVARWVEETHSSIDRASETLDDEIALRGQGFARRTLYRSLWALRVVRLKAGARRAGLYIAHSLQEIDRP